jgi:hypothetical protein
MAGPHLLLDLGTSFGGLLAFHFARARINAYTQSLGRTNPIELNEQNEESVANRVLPAVGSLVLLLALFNTNRLIASIAVIFFVAALVFASYRQLCTLGFELLPAKDRTFVISMLALLAVGFAIATGDIAWWHYRAA